ncbi:F-box/FBD/LRR-repeat protein At1g13570-like [Bidens hawaiensis]|uniref:F-box/FBD/LRR-repeat protein At1g13570-like n=1 Tax=Bidens hawaiensis TaxID=980011 RepID=UPI0040497F11
MKAQRLSVDIITTLPQTKIETILCLLPIDEAARTSILSRKRRYKWTKIPKLVFSNTTGMRPLKTSELLRATHHDQIHEFTLSVNESYLFPKADYLRCELDGIIFHLSRNHTVKKLSLMLVRSNSVLTTLSLNHVWMSKNTLLHLLSNCPSLKSVLLQLIFTHESIVDDKSTMVELFKCLPVIEHLTLWSGTIRWFVPDFVPKELPTSLIHLKLFRLEEISFISGYEQTFLTVLIKNSPNLKKIELKIMQNDYLLGMLHHDQYHSNVWLEHLSGVWLEHLNDLKIENFKNLIPELKFVKFILATRSPKLKKVSITSKVKKDQESEMLKTLLHAPCASAVVIDVV